MNSFGAKKLLCNYGNHETLAKFSDSPVPREYNQDARRWPNQRRAKPTMRLEQR